MSRATSNFSQEKYARKVNGNKLNPELISGPADTNIRGILCDYCKVKKKKITFIEIFEISTTKSMLIFSGFIN